MRCCDFMTVLGRRNHAFFFDGVSDSIVVPQGHFSSIGKTNPEGQEDIRGLLNPEPRGGSESITSGLFNEEITIETWLMPDQGGTVLEKSGQYKLSVGKIHEAAPATFTIELTNGEAVESHTITTGSHNGTRYTGAIYPLSEQNGMFDTKDSGLNRNHRPLVNVVATYRSGRIELYVNGVLMARKIMKDKSLKLATSSENLYIGGKGGEYRGVIEAVHITNDFNPDFTARTAPLRRASTMLLYRFEEPITTYDDVYTLVSSASSGATSISISTTEAAALATKLTGSSVTSGTITFTSSPYTSGNYKVLQSTSSGVTQHDVAHVPYNLLLKPVGVNDLTQAPTSLPPERVRLQSINVGTGALTVASIHLDYNTASSGQRGLLHDHASGVQFVVIGADLLLDSGTGKPYQPPHYSSKAIDRTGQMVIDEGPLGQHGFVYSSQMAISTDSPNNPYAVTWPTTISTELSIGHSGRHTLNHVDGHHYLRMLPKPNEEIIDMEINGVADKYKALYVDSQQGIAEQLPVNTEVSILRNVGQFTVNRVVSSTTVNTIYNSHQSTGSTANGTRKLIAIGGTKFDFTPFFLKAPIHDKGATLDSTVRTHHLRPSKTSRVAILNVPALSGSDYNMSPYVEIHYNAIDLSGASMATENNVACLMVEKTVPAGDTAIGTGGAATTIYDLIDAQIGTFTDATCDTNHTSGLSDGSTTSVRHITMDSTSSLAVGMEVSGTGIPSGAFVSAINNSTAFTLSQDTTATNTNTTLTFTRVGLTLHAPGGYIDINTDDFAHKQELLNPHSLSGDNSEGFDADLTLDESLTPGSGYTPYASDTNTNTTPSVIEDSTSKTTTHESSFHKLFFDPLPSEKDLVDFSDFQRMDVISSGSNAGEPDVLVTSSNSPIYESFDIIDNVEINTVDSNMRLIIHPSDRARTNQLHYAQDALNTKGTPNEVSIHYMMSRAKVKGVLEEDNVEGRSYTTVECWGLQNNIGSRNISAISSGSPDSNVVKEIEPNAPVVSVTLGGPGQGGVDTKPTFTKSPFSHKPFSTRRAYAVATKQFDYNHSSGAFIITVQPLNNQSSDMKSWGTFGFPNSGRVYFADGSSAKYDSRSLTTFTFSNATAGSGDFITSDGNEFTGILPLLKNIGATTNSATGITGVFAFNVTLFSEPDFGDESMIDNGTNVNDRMFQSLSDISHDYQLGTQYASTRALVEIPFFSNQFFNNPDSGTFVGPGNAFKIHLDATHTAHTYNPSPVGRRPKGIEPADREANSAYSISIAKGEHVPYSRIVKWDSSNRRIYVEDASKYPAPSASGSFKNLTSVPRYRRAFLSSGEWVVYSAVDTSNNYLTVPANLSYVFSTNFLNELRRSERLPLLVGLHDDTATAMASDVYTPSSDFENRGEYYYDQASAMTQGGNVDYGLRQYVSAVSFKSGPETNPHAPRVEPKRAKGEIVGIDIQRDNAEGGHTYVVSLSEEDFARFPNLGSRNSNTASGGTIGSLLYEAVVDVNGTEYRFHYYGHLDEISGTSSNTAIPNSAIVIAHYEKTGSYFTPSDLIGSEVILKQRTRRIMYDEYIAAYAGGSFTNNIPPALSTVDPLYRELLNNIYFGAVFSASSSGSGGTTLTVTGTNSVNDLFDFNVRKDDKIFYKYADGLGDVRVGFLGTVTEHIADTNALKFEIDTTNLHSTVTTQLAADSGAQIGVLVNDFKDVDAVLNATWLNPYAPGGLRDGDTIWANMSYNNPHAVEGLFAKSRGVYNEGEVWSEFNGGQGTLAASNPRDSIPLENFLIGANALETARNYAQHVNRTIEENYVSLGLSASLAPTVAYVDPYLANEGHARVLLYDVAHDREFIAFQDIHMQVQSSADATHIGWNRHVVQGTATTMTDLATHLPATNGAAPYAWTTQIDVANGFPSQNRYIRSTQQSKFIESAYAHDLANKQSDDLTGQSVYSDDATQNNYSRLFGKAHGHHVHVGFSINGAASNQSYSFSTPPRTQESVTTLNRAIDRHSLSRKSARSFIDSLVKFREVSGKSLRDPSTFFDTPDGTRVIPAFLCLKGIRSSSLDLSSHAEANQSSGLRGIKHLPQWTDMDFVRRLTIDAGEIAEKEGVVDVLSGVTEIVRKINQYGALNARMSKRTIEVFDGGLSRALGRSITSTAEVAGGSAHDPAVWWDVNQAFTSTDSGTHMGYLRAHLGREVEDADGNIGHTIVIHSTVPGASGRNFCVWLDNSTSQTTYKPEFLIGHGGRWRNFWALPDEREGENMHPAPMPLDKNGRPFAPITTLKQYIDSDESGEDVVSVADIGTEEKTDFMSISDVISGKNHNSINRDSFDLEGSTSTLVNGLRIGKRAISRINFGGLVATGVPGWAPVAGTWGFGKNGESTYNARYGSSSTTKTYSSHISANMLDEENIGKGQLYGFRLKDHLGGEHGIRFIYSRRGQVFANTNTKTPDTLQDEICVFFDDRSSSQGGFTVGTSMMGSGDATGRLVSSFTDQSWRGARWNAKPAPEIAVRMSLAFASTSFTATLSAPYRFTDDTCDYNFLGVNDPTITMDSTAFLVPGMAVSGSGIPTGATVASITNTTTFELSTSTTGSAVTNGTLTFTHPHPDILGYLGFPLENGVLQMTDAVTSQDDEVGRVVSYERRVGNTFYNVQNAPATSGTDIKLVSPTINWSCLVTDELMSAVTAAAINKEDANSVTFFDCTSMYAADGRTFGEWGVTPDAIQIVAFNTERNVTPLSKLFNAVVAPDLGIQAAHLEFGEIQKAELTADGVWDFGTSAARTDAEIDAGMRIDCGYIPKTLLEIRTKGVGPNANTATPVFVDSDNNPVSTVAWRKNLTGESYTSVSGDHIIPKIDNPILQIDRSEFTDSNWATDNQFKTVTNTYHFLIPASSFVSGDASRSIGQKAVVYLDDEKYAVVESVNDSATFASNSSMKWFSDTEVNWPSTRPAQDEFLHLHLERKFAGIRSIGSVFSEPIVLFRGGKSSPDHSVPLFFGGGFSGVVMDVNDGSNNDYSQFYTHPYANGPTGTAGIQNANEISTSFAMLDCNAILAFFPGTALLNQHRASALPPFFNKDNVLSTDLDRGGTTYTAGVVKAKAVPLVLRFPHPTARYDDHVNGVDNKTTYLVFGPGQAFPIREETSVSNPKEPHPGRVITTGNSFSKVPLMTKAFHNHINNEDRDYLPPDKTEYLTNAAYHWRAMVNWESPAGYPLGRTYKQRPSHGRMYGQMIWDESTFDDRTQPLRHTPFIGYGIAMAADTVFHMDGGFHPGGSWLDDQLTFNPPKNDARISVSGYSKINPTAFRVAGAMLKSIVTGSTTIADKDTDMEYIAVDATRCQNGEELATVLGAAINTFPGKGALKAIGGTHMPSMGNAMRQDRYGWIDIGAATGTYQNSSHPYYIESVATSDRDLLENLPASGWIRGDIDNSATTNAASYACYFMKQIILSGTDFKARFYLAPNRKENVSSADANFLHDNGGVTPSSSKNLYVWSKSGVIRYNNESVSARDHMTQVHFSGIADAVDRTKPVGAVGWHGERYSYLNSLKITTSVTKNTSTTNTTGYAAGLGAYHPFLNFSPYGSAGTVMNTYGQLPLIAPLFGSPESTPAIDGGQSATNQKGYIETDLTQSVNIYTDNIFSSSSYSRSYNYRDAEDAAPNNLFSDPTNYVMSQANTSNTSILPDELQKSQGVYTSAFLVISYESELALVAKRDRDGTSAVGDWLYLRQEEDISDSGTTIWDDRIHGQDRYTAPANAGPNVEALIADGTAVPVDTIDANWIDDLFPTGGGAYKYMHSAVSSDTNLSNATPDRAKTGDLIHDLDFSPGSFNLQSGEAERNVAEDKYSGTAYTAETGFSNQYWLSDVNAFQTQKKFAAKNFSVENIVWKRMDGGNLSLPTLDARGLGAVPFVTRVKSNTKYLTGEKIYGNVRFSFETTNSAMMPVLQAQEISQPQLSEKNIFNVKNILQIPNEEIQFEEILVVDDAGQEHVIEGGSPLGTIIRTFNLSQFTSQETTTVFDAGLGVFSNVTENKTGPALANSGLKPRLAVQLPNPDSIPGNLVVRSGFDPIQAYQNETFGSGGMQHPGDNSTRLSSFYDTTYGIGQGHPTYEEVGWEHYDPVNEKSKIGGLDVATLKNSYELHDRALFFHVTKMGHSSTHRYPNVYTTGSNSAANDVEAQTLTFVSFSSGVVTVNAAPNVHVWKRTFTNGTCSYNNSTSVSIDSTASLVIGMQVSGTGIPTGTIISSISNSTSFELSAATTGGSTTGTLTFKETRDFGSREENDDRRYMRLYNPTTGESGVATYTGISGSTFTGVKADANFTTLAATSDTMYLVPSFYIPAGSNRFFAARRLRDHAEVSGNSPDMAHTEYITSVTNAYDRYTKPVMTPMPYPRMGHHYVNATQPMLPGHWAHPVYQSLYKKHRAEQNMLRQTMDGKILLDAVKASAENVPTKSDLSIGNSINPMEAEINFSAINAAPSGPSDLHGGAFTLMFETAVKWDGYGVLASQGNAGTMNKAGGHSITLQAASSYTLANHFPDPAEVGAYQIIIQPNLFSNQLGGADDTTYALTAQQVNTVIGIRHDESNTGAMTLVLARSTEADVRGCEVMINEMMLDINPDFGSQFTNIPKLLLYNPYGVNLNESPSFSRRGFPYSPMFSDSTPGVTLNVPWWSVLFADIASDDLSNDEGFRGLAQSAPHNYYSHSRSTYGSIGNTLTMQGYPTIYPDIYSHILQNTSNIPICIVQSFNTSTRKITVDNASSFPSLPRFGKHLQYTGKDGKTYSAPYTSRSGFSASEINIPTIFTLPSTTTSTNFLNNIFDGAEITLSSTYNTISENTYAKDRTKSIFATNLDDIKLGTRDTNNLNPPDAFLCLWHENLGRPYTIFSESTSRAWNAEPVDADRYNALPEHYETIHYHSATYAMSLGPFSLKVKAQKTGDATGGVHTVDTNNDAGGASGSEFGSVLYNRYWPCGSRGGPQASSLEEYTIASASWSKPGDYDQLGLNWADGSHHASDGSYTVATGISSSTSNTKRRAFGYRIAVRQAYNRPRWGLLPARAVYEGSASGSGLNTTNYDSGPIIQMESHGSIPLTYTGILERSTNFTGMLNNDIAGHQVRYAQGRRMSRPFGTPLRTLRNPATDTSASITVQRDWWGDSEPKGITELSEASQYYLVDWWGNERGEDVRRAPVRGFGIRPAWDCGNAYKMGSNTPFDRIWNSGKPLFNVKNVINSSGNVSVTADFTVPRFGGTQNDSNLSGSNNDLVDVFSPVHSLRVGCMGNGRGSRYPTSFNECIFTDVSVTDEKTGVVLSSNTSEPTLGAGFTRPRNDVLQADEIKRGISSKLSISEDGLLKPEANVGGRTDTIVGSSKHLEPISRTSPRIGIDAPLYDGLEENHVAITTEAHSLHTDRNMGQRVSLSASLQRDTRTAANIDLPTSFSRDNTNGSLVSGVLRFSHTNSFRPYGGSYILEVRSYAGSFDDTGWGKNNIAAPTKSSNPYQNATRKLTTKPNNRTDKSVKFLIRPIRQLDDRHVEMYRLNDNLDSTSPQYTLGYLNSTSGGKYGYFNYEVDNPASSSFYVGSSNPNANGPYYPLVLFTSDYGTVNSQGPTIQTSEQSSFDNTDLTTGVGRLLVSENTLQHHRADSVRAGDFSVKPRFSQTLHPKGHKGDVTFGTDDHSGDSP